MVINNIDWINEHSPYEVTVENERMLNFTTDSGKTMGCGFVRYVTLGCHTFNYFYFNLEQGLRGGEFDHKMAQTTTLIIRSFLNEHPDDVVFFCHQHQKHTAGLLRIFTHWCNVYKEQHKEDQSGMLYLEGKNRKDERYHAVFFIGDGCSEREELIEALREQIDDLIGTFREMWERYKDLSINPIR